MLAVAGRNPERSRLRKALLTSVALAGAMTAVTMTTAAAQTTITYNDGDVIAAPIVLTGPGTTVLDIAAGSAEQAGIISGGAGASPPLQLDKTGAGTLILSGANSYSALTHVLQGTLKAGSGSAFGNGVMQISAGAALDLNGFSTALSNLSGTGELRLGGSSATILSLQDGDFAGAITGAGGVRQLAGGTTVLSGSNAYTGGTTIDAGGTLQLGNATKAGSLIGTVTNDGIFDIVNGTTGGLTIATTGEVYFRGASSAGNGAITISPASGLVVFSETSSAGAASIVNRGALFFVDGSSAGAASILNKNGGAMAFAGTATAGQATIVNEGSTSSLVFAESSSAGQASISNSGVLFFAQDARAGHARITNQDGGVIVFGAGPGTTERASADHATIHLTSQGVLVFQAEATAGNATIIVEKDGLVLFYDNATGGNARFIAKAGAEVDFSASYGPNNDGRISAGSIAGAGTFWLGSNELTVGSDNRSTEVSGSIIDGCGCGGGSLVKVGTGTLTLSGVNTYTGPTTVEAGTLVVNGSLISAVTVNAAGTLGGTGVIGGLVLNGILAPGNSIGTITVNGNAQFNPGSTTVLEMSSSGIDRIKITGTATLGGNLRLVGLGGGFSFATRYSFLTAAGGITGNFETLTFGGQFGPGIGATLSTNANEVLVSLSPNALTPLLAPGTGANAVAVARALDRAVAGGADVSAFMPLYLLPAAAMPEALGSLSGEAGTGAQETALRAASLFLNLMLDPMAGARGAQATFASPSLVQMADPPAAAAPSSRAEPSWNFWTKAFGQSARIDGDRRSGAAATSGGLYGVAAGADRRLTPDSLIGFALGGGGTSYGLGGRGGGTGDLFQIGLYGSTRLGDGYLSAALAYGWNSFEIKRNVDLAGSQLYRSGVTAQTFGGRIESGWRFGHRDFGWTPYAALEVIGYSTPGYAETAAPAGAAFGLTYAAKSLTTARTELGLRLDGRSQLAPGMDLVGFGRLAWAYQPTTERSATAAFQALANSAFTVFGARPSMNTALASAGAELRLATGLSLSTMVEAELGDRHSAIRANLGLRQVW